MWHHYFLMDSDRFRQLSLVQNLDMQGNVGKHRAWQGFFDFYSLWKTQGAKWFLFFFAAFRADGARRPLVSPPPPHVTPMDVNPDGCYPDPLWLVTPMDVALPHGCQPPSWLHPFSANYFAANQVPEYHRFFWKEVQMLFTCLFLF